MSTTTIDCRDMHYPMPIVKMAKVIKSLAVGDKMQVMVADAAFAPDVQAWVRKTGHELEHLEFQGSCHIATIRKTK